MLLGVGALIVKEEMSSYIMEETIFYVVWFQLKVIGMEWIFNIVAYKF